MDLSSPGIRPPLPADDVWVGPTELDLDEGNSSPPRKSEMKLCYNSFKVQIRIIEPKIVAFPSITFF